jgi:restriction system protein
MDMDSLAATAQVLSETAGPLSSGEITRLILERGLWQSAGKTPEQTVNARLAVDIKRRGSSSQFQRTAPGHFALRIWGLPEYHLDRTQVTAKGPETKKLPLAKSAKTKSFTDAAEEILLKYGNKRPMHYRAITNTALDLKLLKTQGQTPEATLYAQILSEIGRQARRGVTPRFSKHGKGFVGLSRWLGIGLAFQIEQHNLDVRKKLHSQLLSNGPAEFEKLIGKLLVALGFEDVVVTGRSGDGGIDVRGTLVVGDVIRTRMAVQAKRWKQNVQGPTIQQVRGSLGTHEQGLIVTTSDFSSGARSEAERADAIPVALMAGEQLVALLVEHGIGIRREAHDLIELGETEDE